jgi:CubicO group peptidase (beta-lactamase class C family)
VLLNIWDSDYNPQIDFFLPDKNDLFNTQDRDIYMKCDPQKMIISAFCILLLPYLTLFSQTMLPQQNGYPTEGWRSALPEEQGIDSNHLADMLEVIQNRQHAIRCVLIIRNGYMVTSAYFYPFPEDTWHVLQSCTKSIMSTLIGIAFNQGAIESIDTHVLQFFPDRVASNLDTNKKKITLKHLLTMSSGLKTEDSYLYRWQGLRKMTQSPDWIQYVLDLPMANPPGSTFEYSNCVSYLLSAILTQRTDMDALSFAEEHLFRPLGIRYVDWWASPQGISMGWSGIRMKPEDLAKIGLLYLNHGKWEDKEILSSDWAESATTQQIRAGTLSSRYGYHWWIDSDGHAAMLGFGGQYLILDPNNKLIVLFFSALQENEVGIPVELFKTYILSGLETTPLPPNPEGYDRLKAVIENIKTPKSQPVDSLPPIAKKISGKRYQFDPNNIQFHHFCLTFDPEKPTAKWELAFGPKSIRVDVGLDNVYRRTWSAGFLRAYKGSWINDSTFVFQYQVLDYTERGSAKLTFKGDEVIGWFEEVIEGSRNRLTGKIQPKR